MPRDPKQVPLAALAVVVVTGAEPARLAFHLGAASAHRTPKAVLLLFGGDDGRDLVAQLIRLDLLHLRILPLAQSLVRERVQQLGDFRVVVEALEQVLARQHEDVAGRVRGDRRRTTLRQQAADLAEEAAGEEREEGRPLIAREHLARAVLDEEHLLGDVVLADDEVERHVEVEHDDLDELPHERLVDPLEERHLVEQLLVKLEANVEADRARQVVDDRVVAEAARPPPLELK
eukprot:3598239-Prymnesium_polylepis.1